MGNFGAAILIGLPLLLVYFLPTIVAAARGHMQTTAIFVLNLLLGWTLLGWIVALVCSFKANTQAERIAMNPTYVPPPRIGSVFDAGFSSSALSGLGALVRRTPPPSAPCPPPVPRS